MFDHNSILIGHQCVTIGCRYIILLRPFYPCEQKKKNSVILQSALATIIFIHFPVYCNHCFSSKRKKKRRVVKTNWYFVGSFTLHFFFCVVHFIRMRHEIVAWTSFFFFHLRKFNWMVYKNHIFKYYIFFSAHKSFKCINILWISCYLNST